jgi:NAD(P)-dependent dehydrogenase (short-subunit alcohol dehydrogenase family)
VTNTGSRVAIVTGGASGIGEGTVHVLAEHGYAVAIWDVNEEAAKAVLAGVESAGGRGLAVAVDVSQPDQVEDATARTVAELGPPVALVNNAGIRDLIPFFDITLADWNRIIGVDLTGPFLCTQTVGRIMAQNGGGAIVNIASIASVISFPDRTAYVAAKTGVVGLTRSNAEELAHFGIRVNAINPGGIVTPLAAETFVRPEGVGIVDRTPLGRAGHPRELANAVAFLLSDESSYITGATLTVDGGRSVVEGVPRSDQGSLGQVHVAR